MQSRPKILLIEDEKPIIALLQYNLEAKGYKFFIAENGDDGISMAIDVIPDLILLDWMMPGRSGLSVCKTLRQHPTLAQCPIIMVSARGEEQDLNKGLRAGADAYIRKPFSIAELLGLVETYLSARKKIETGTEVFELDEITLDTAANKAFRAGRDLGLGVADMMVLRAMIAKPGQIFQRSELIQFLEPSDPAGWQGLDEAKAIRKLDAIVRTLRKRLTADGEPDPIKSIRGAGYALERRV